VAEEHTAETIAQLEQEIELLKKENERLRQLLEEALRAAKRQVPSRGRNPKLSPKDPDAKQESSMGAAIAGPFPTPLMRLSRYAASLLSAMRRRAGRVPDRFSVPNRDSGTAGAAH
jgi:hypothetical protein